MTWALWACNRVQVGVRVARAAVSALLSALCGQMGYAEKTSRDVAAKFVAAMAKEWHSEAAAAANGGGGDGTEDEDTSAGGDAKDGAPTALIAQINAHINTHVVNAHCKPLCGCTGCAAPVCVEGSRIHDYCSKTCARKAGALQGISEYKSQYMQNL